MIKIIFLTVALAWPAYALPQNNPAQKREIETFHAIDISHGIRLVIASGASETLSVTASATQHAAKVETKVEDGVLKIYWSDDTWKNSGNSKDKPTVAVTIKHIDAIVASYGSNIQVEGELKETALTIKASTGANFNGKIETETLNIEQASGSVVKVIGEADNLSIAVIGGSMFSGFDLVAGDCNAVVSEGSHASITVSKTLKGQATAGSEVRYKGRDVMVDMKTSGESEVRRKRSK